MSHCFKWPFRISALLIFALVFLGGCSHLATPQEKEDSFSPYAQISIGRSSLREYMEQRTAVLIAGAMPQAIELRDGQIGVRLRATSADGKVDVGSAASVLGDGYYVTAAHCLRRQPVFLIIPGTIPARAHPARIVWQPSENDPACDVAILHVDHTAQLAFDDFARSPARVGAVLVTTGANGEAAGKLLSIQEEPAQQNHPKLHLLIHSAPLNHGDSGGPLVALDGTLQGVEVQVRGVYFGPRQGIALAADPEWLNAVIQADTERGLRGPASRQSME